MVYFRWGTGSGARGPIGRTTIPPNVDLGGYFCNCENRFMGPRCEGKVYPVLFSSSSSLLLDFEFVATAGMSVATGDLRVSSGQNSLQKWPYKNKQKLGWPPPTCWLAVACVETRAKNSELELSQISNMKVKAYSHQSKVGSEAKNIKQ